MFNRPRSNFSSEFRNEIRDMNNARRRPALTPEEREAWKKEQVAKALAKINKR